MKKLMPFMKSIIQLKRFLPNKSSVQSVSGSGQKAWNQINKVKLENPLKSVGMKLFIIFISTILVLVLSQGFISYYLSKDIIKDKVSLSSQGTIKQAADKLDLFFQNIEGITMSIFLNEELRDTIREVETGNLEPFDQMQKTQKANSMLNEMIFSNKMLTSITIFNLEGDYRFNAGATVTKNMGEDPWFKEAIEKDGKVLWVESQKEGIVNKALPTFAVSRVLKDMNSNTAEFVLLLEVNLEPVANLMQSVELGTDSQVNLISEEHQIVYNANEELLGSKLSNVLQKDENDKIERTAAFENENEDGKSQLVVYSKSSITGWYLAGTIPTAKLVEEAGKIQQNTLVTALVALIVAIVIGVFVARMIGKPLIQLRNLMKEGEQGNLRVSTDFRRKDEIGQVGDSFNRMMEQISKLVEQTNRSAQEVLATAEDLSEASKNTAVSAKEIAQATEEIAEGSTSLASEAERGNELTLNISEQMRRVVDANTKMGQAAGEVQSVSEQGTGYMADLIHKTGMTEEMTRSMVEKVDRVKDSTRSIRKILDVLGNMTKQTNILSLNATIEAARAGAAGKGFMVVADEIRKLADQSRQSISVVGEITDKIQREIDETVEVLMNAYPIFQEQIMSVKEADQIFKQVRSQMNSFVVQLDGVTDSIGHLEESQTILSAAMSNVSAFSEESSATSQEVASLSTQQLTVSEGLVRLSERLENLSTDLKESLSKFHV